MSTDVAPHNLTSATSNAPYIPFASSNHSDFPPWKAFDGLAGSVQSWLGQNGGVDWLALDLGADRRVKLLTYDVKVNTVPEASRAPKDWTMQGSNDNSAWTTLHTVTNQTSWTSGEVRSFSCSDTSTAYRYFRINITANNGDATYTQVAELYLWTDDTLATAATEFGPHDLTSSTSHSPYVVSASSEFSGLNAWRAFDGGTNYWIGTSSGVDWLKIDIGSGSTKVLGTYEIKVNVIPEPNRAPKNWTMQGSNDNSAWTTLDTRTNQTSWLSGMRRSYHCAGNHTVYRYYRLNITANNGDSTYTQVAELYLYEQTESSAATGTLTCHADAGCDWLGAAIVGTLEYGADAGTQFYGHTRGSWECDADAGASFTGRVTEWHVSGLRMDAEAGASFIGHATGIGTLRMDADAGFEVWPRLRAIPESCLGAITEPAPSDEEEVLSNYVF